jgi:photosystem II stability/assembly factor-like uncharacterized protein
MLAPLTGEAAPWQRASIPLENANIRAAVLAPSLTARIYIAPNLLGVYRTDDRGDVWTSTSSGLPLDLEIVSLAVAAQDADLVLAGSRGEFPDGRGRVFRSTDGGERWLETGELDGNSVEAILVDPADADVLLAGVTGGAQPGVYRSVNGGATWVVSSTGIEMEHVSALTRHPADPSIVLAGTQEGAARSTDGGLTWTPGGTGASFTSFSWSLADPARVFAVHQYGSGLYRSDDAGVTFTEIPRPPDIFEFDFVRVTRAAAHPTDPMIVTVAGADICPEDPFGFEGLAGVWRSTDAGASWAPALDHFECHTGSPTALLQDPVEPQWMYVASRAGGEVGGHEDGFRRSATGGPGSWTVKIAGIHNFAVQVVRSDRQGKVYARGGGRLFSSSDPEGAWTEVSFSIGGGELGQIYGEYRFEPNFRTPDLLFEAGTGIFGDILIGYAVRSEDGGVNWLPPSLLPPGLPPSQPTLVVSNHGDGQVVYVWSAGSWCYRSDDGGESYAQVSTSIAAKAAVIDAANPMRLFAAELGTEPVSLSTDGGVTWEPRSSGLPVVTGGFQTGPFALFLAEEDPDRLVVVYHEKGVHETLDGGLSWHAHPWIDPGDVHVNDAAWDPELFHVYLATDGEGLLSTHSGVSSEGLPTLSPAAVEYDPVHRVLLVGTENEGLYVLPIPEGTGAPAVPAAAGPLALRVQPTPFRNATSLEFGVPAGGADVVLEVLDAGGRRVATLVERRQDGGWQRVSWSGRNSEGRRVPSGVYFVRLTIAGETAVRKTTLVR